VRETRRICLFQPNQLTLTSSPSSEWQDTLTAKLNARAIQRNTLVEGGESFGETDSQDLQSLAYPPSPSDDGASQQDRRPSADSRPTTSAAGGDGSLSASADANDQHRRQKRRVEDASSGARSPSNASLSGRSQSPAHYAHPPPHPALLSKRSSLSGNTHSASPEAPGAEADMSSEDEDTGSGEDELAVAVGQLSINEDEQVRYHGKASGLHLLGVKERQDGRNEGEIW
jgi:hypothetical protein